MSPKRNLELQISTLNSCNGRALFKGPASPIRCSRLSYSTVGLSSCHQLRNRWACSAHWILVPRELILSQVAECRAMPCQCQLTWTLWAVLYPVQVSPRLQLPCKSSTQPKKIRLLWSNGSRRRSKQHSVLVSLVCFVPLISNLFPSSPKL